MTSRRTDRYISRPLIDVNAVWMHEDSIYPDMVRIPMHSGKVKRYFQDVAQPSPVLISPKEKHWTVGYSCRTTEKERLKKWATLLKRRKNAETTEISFGPKKNF